MSSARCGLRPRNLYHGIYTLAVGDALLKHCAAIVVHGHNSLAGERSPRHPLDPKCALQQRFPTRRSRTRRPPFFFTCVRLIYECCVRESEVTRGEELYVYRKREIHALIFNYEFETKRGHFPRLKIYWKPTWKSPLSHRGI